MAKFLEGKESEGTARIRVTSGVTVNKEPHQPGDVVTTSLMDALFLIRIGAAEYYGEGSICGVKF
jgi:hypothetical protein